MDNDLLYAFIVRRGRMRNFGTLGGDFASAVEFNDRGQVVGEGATTDGARHIFIWDRGVMPGLGTLGGPFTLAAVINDRKQIAGVSENADGLVTAFFWERGRMRDIGSTIITFSPTAINSRGEVLLAKDIDDVPSAKF